MSQYRHDVVIQAENGETIRTKGNVTFSESKSDEGRQDELTTRLDKADRRNREASTNAWKEDLACPNPYYAGGK